MMTISQVKMNLQNVTKNRPNFFRSRISLRVRAHIRWLINLEISSVATVNAALTNGVDKRDKMKPSELYRVP